MPTIEVAAEQCKVCGFTWVPRTPNPATCANPKCRSRYWNIGRQRAPIAEQRAAAAAQRLVKGESALQSVPVLGFIYGGAAQEVRPLPGTTVTPPFHLPAGSYGLIVIGNSMEQETGLSIPDGSYAFFNPNEMPSDGSIVHAEWPRPDGSNECTLKRFHGSALGGATFEPLNPEYEPITRREGEYEIRGVFLRSWDGNP